MLHTMAWCACTGPSPDKRHHQPVSPRLHQSANCLCHSRHHTHKQNMQTGPMRRKPWSSAAWRTTRAPTTPYFVERKKRRGGGSSSSTKPPLLLLSGASSVRGSLEQALHELYSIQRPKPGCIAHALVSSEAVHKPTTRTRYIRTTSHEARRGRRPTTIANPGYLAFPLLAKR